MNMGRLCWEIAWTVRVVWISFRPSEPETWVRILHGPPKISTKRMSSVLTLEIEFN